MSPTLTQATFDPPHTACDLCASTQIIPYHQDFRGIHIFKCQACGVQFMNPVYSDDHLEEYYSHYTNENAEEEEPEVYCHGFYMSLVERMARQKGRLLDVGTGSGFLLKVAKERGWIPVGYDVDPATVDRIGKKLGVEILTGRFTDMVWPKETYDCVAMHHALEHVKSPSAYLKVIHSILKPGGVLLVVVPNIQSVSSQVKFLLEKWGIRRQKVGAYYDTPHHLWYFSPRPLGKFLLKNGFVVRYMRSGHQARANQSNTKRFWMRNISERFLWKSTFLVIAEKS